MKFTVDDHWLNPCYRTVCSPNCDERPNEKDISLIVLHNISLPPGSFEMNSVVDFFTNQLDISGDDFYPEIAHLKVSSHLYLSRDGQIIQFVPFSKRAWHAGVSCFGGREACNDFSIGIELAGADDIAYTQAQYQALIAVIRTLHRCYPKTQQMPVVGHCHIAPGRKTDPGGAFQWHRLVEAGIGVFSAAPRFSL